MEGYTEYNYERGNANNPERVYPEGHSFAGSQKYLSREIGETFPTKDFRVKCDGTNLCVLVKNEDDFSPAEKITLDQVISDHKNNA